MMGLLAREAAKRVAEATAGVFLAAIATKCAESAWARVFGEEPKRGEQ